MSNLHTYRQEIIKNSTTTTTTTTNTHKQNVYNDKKNLIFKTSIIENINETNNNNEWFNNYKF